MSADEIIEKGLIWLCRDARRTMPKDAWILGFGSCARRNGSVRSWSDIDIIVCRNDGYSQAQANAQRIHSQLVTRFGLASTIIVVDDRLIMDRFRDVSPFNSVLLNAMSGRPDTSRFLVGKPCLEAANLEHEIRNAQSYLSHTRSAVSRLLIENCGARNMDDLRRTIKWISSIIRCYSRTEGKFLGPYEEALLGIEWRLSRSSIFGLRQLFAMRFRWDSIGSNECETAMNQASQLFADLWPLCEWS
jgi:predicted nucleotidyltransferase